MEEDFSFLTRPEIRIVDSHLKKVCKCEQGSSACRYICQLAIQDVYVCVKNTPLKKYIDNTVLNNEKWIAKGDNCDGFQLIYEKSENKEESNKEESNKEEQKNCL